MEAIGDVGRLSTPTSLPKTSSFDTPIFAPSIDYKSPNNIADSKKKEYTQVLRSIGKVEDDIAKIRANVKDLESKTKNNPYDRRSAEMLEYALARALTNKFPH
jgi:hypothetical protein